LQIHCSILLLKLVMIAFTVLLKEQVSLFGKSLVSKKGHGAGGHSSQMAIAPAPVLEFKQSFASSS